METIIQNSAKHTELNDRVLFFDGDTVAKTKYLHQLLLSGIELDASKIHPKKISKEIKKYNKMFDDEPLTIKEEIKPYDLSWNIPEKYKNLDLNKYVLKLLFDELVQNSFSNEEQKERTLRTRLELQLWQEKNLTDLLRTLIYIVDTLEENNIVWGTGRGSSCCCYILYLIKLHDVDSIRYNLDLKEFFR